MEKIDYKVENYFVEFLGSNPSSDDKELRARILLFSSQIKGVAAELRFYPLIQLWMKQDALKESAPGKSALIGHMPIDALHSVIDVLRNEQPIYVVWLEASQQVSLRTHLEPVGEGER